MAYQILLISIGAAGLLAAFIVPVLRKSRISNLQNIDYITQFTMYLSAFVMLLPQDRSESTFLITLIILLSIPVLSGLQYLIARWRLKKNIGLRCIGSRISFYYYRKV